MHQCCPTARSDLAHRPGANEGGVGLVLDLAGHNKRNRYPGLVVRKGVIGRPRLQRPTRLPPAEARKLLSSAAARRDIIRELRKQKGLKFDPKTAIPPAQCQVFNGRFPPPHRFLVSCGREPDDADEDGDLPRGAYFPDSGGRITHVLGGLGTPWPLTFEDFYLVDIDNDGRDEATYVEGYHDEFRRFLVTWKGYKPTVHRLP